MKPNVAIIILNWNGWKDTIECLESLYNIEYPNYNIIVVDNKSSDDSIEKIKEYCNEKTKIESEFANIESNKKPLTIFEYNENELKEPSVDQKKIFTLNSDKKIILIKNRENYGFAGGNNIGIRYALDFLKSEYILLLNNDTLVESNFLNQLVEVIERDETIGSVQSLLLRPGGKVIDSLGQELSYWGAKDKGIGEEYTKNIVETEIFGACAASALYRGDLLRKIGLFDEIFFMIFEDLDLSWRIRINSNSSILVPKSVVYHKRGLSGEQNLNSAKEYIIKKNWLIIAFRYYPLTINYEILSWLYHAFKLAAENNEFWEFSTTFTKNIFIRIFTKRDPSLKSLQDKWINKSPS